jgi:hypothetical protein
MAPPLDILANLGVLGRQDVTIGPGLRHLEIYTWDGLLTLLWHEAPGAAEDHETPGVVLCCGGALGGLLGPASGLYHHLGTVLAGRGLHTLRVSYRAPNSLDSCVLDTLAAAELATRRGAERFVVVGHSFGGAVAIQAGVLLGDACAGVVTLATQSAGCEPGEHLAGKVPVLHLHGDTDPILPHYASQMVQMLTEGEVRILPGAGHLLVEAEEEVERSLQELIPARFGSG